MATVDILYLIFNQLLRIDPMTISRYMTPQEQLLNLFFIPHIILFLFIYGLSWVLAPMHKGMRYLFAIGAYLTLVLTGTPYSYYGTMLPFLLGWWYLALIVGFFFFIWSRVIHPSKVPELFNIGKGVATKATEKGKRKKAIDKEIDLLNKQIRSYRREASSADPTASSYIRTTIAHLEAQKKALEHEKDNL
ncbi:MAG: prefoldin domain-containing protein [Candidatus Aenigmatarchaeota archaeon]